MTVARIENIELRESPVMYRRVYTARAVIAHAGAAEQTVAIEFTVEDTAANGKQLSVRFLETPDYPLMPLNRAVREHLETLETQGEFV